MMCPDVESYLTKFHPDVMAQLQRIRQNILQLDPGVTEGVAYGMPAYKWMGKPLVYFAGFPKHIGLYALPATHAHFGKELAEYKQGKGSVQFPLHQEIPHDLIERMIRYRLKLLKEEMMHRD